MISLHDFKKHILRHFYVLTLAKFWETLITKKFFRAGVQLDFSFRNRPYMTSVWFVSPCLIWLIPIKCSSQLLHSLTTNKSNLYRVCSVWWEWAVNQHRTSTTSLAKLTFCFRKGTDTFVIVRRFVNALVPNFRFTLRCTFAVNFNTTTLLL